MNTYLLVSETNYFIKDKLEELTKGITNVMTFNMNENTMDEILEEASYFSMFNDKKGIIVKNANFFSASKSGDSSKGKEDANKLIKYLDNENKNTILIFTISKVDTKKKIYTLLKNNNCVFTFNNMTKTEMKNELSKVVLNNKYKIDDKSLWYIINNSLNNFDLAVNELNKIMLYYSNPGYIKYEDVVNLTSKTLIDNNFKLVQSIINKDLENSLQYIQELKILKIEPTIIISLLYREFKLMLSVLTYEKINTSEHDILNNLKLATWQYEKIKSNLRFYNEKEIKKQIVNLSDIDYKLKSGNLNKDVALTLYTLELCD